MESGQQELRLSIGCRASHRLMGSRLTVGWYQGGNESWIDPEEPYAEHELTQMPRRAGSSYHDGCSLNILDFPGQSLDAESRHVSRRPLGWLNLPSINYLHLGHCRRTAY
jgi:hypothetical protein